MIDTEARAGAPAAAAAAPAAAPAAARAPAAAPAAASAATTVAAAGAGPKSGVAMPAAAKLMAESGLTAAQVAGTGRDGRITKGDVIGAAAAGARPAPAPVPIPTGVPMSSLPEVRPALELAQLTNAILTTFNEVNMQPVMDLRKRYQDRFEKEHGVRLGFMSFFVKAAVHALRKYPVVNASVDGNDIVYHGYFDIGVAVGSP